MGVGFDIIRRNVVGEQVPELDPFLVVTLASQENFLAACIFQSLL